MWLLLSVSSVAIAQDLDDHDHDHEGLHFSHPIVSESPSPDTKMRVDYGFTDITENDEELSQNGARLEAEYALHPSFSIEFEVPYRWQSRTAASLDVGPERSLPVDDVEVPPRGRAASS